MPKVTQKQLVEQLKMLKTIKPRKEWANLLKSQILPQETLEHDAAHAESVSFESAMPFSLLRNKLAYAFAVILFLVVGVFGFARYTMPGDLLFPIRELAEQSQASLTGTTGIKQNVAVLSDRINDLAMVAKEGKTNNIPSAINEVSQNASALAKNLEENPVNDPSTLNEIESGLKTLSDVPGTDLTTNSAVQDLTQETVAGLIAYYQGVTLTDNQKKILSETEDLYNQGKYADASVEIYNINQPVKE